MADQNNNQNKSSNSEGKSNTVRIAIAVTIIVVVIVAAVLIGARNRRHTSEVPTTSAPQETTAPQASSNTNSSASSSGLSYEDAVKAYEGKSIQFSSATTNQNQCVATPAQQVFKTGTRILLDNRSAQTISVALQGKSVTLRPYHYATTSLASTGTFTVDCNTQQNVATVTVEK